MRSCIFLVLLMAGMSSCTSTLWGIPLDDWHKAKSEGNFSFLRTLELSPGPLPDLTVLGPGAAYSLGILLEKEGRIEDSLRFLTASLEREGEPYAQWAFQRLSAAYSGKQDWSSLEQSSRKFLEIFPGSVVAARDLVEALYWQKKDVEVLFRIKAGKWDSLPGPQIRELGLFRAVSALRTAHPETGLFWKELLWNQPASPLHYRAYTFFEQDLLRYDSLASTERLLLKFKALVGERKYTDAWEAYRELRSKADFRPDAQVLGDLGPMVNSLDLAPKVRDDMVQLLPLTDPTLRWLILFHRGRAEARTGQQKRAADFLTQSISEAPSSETRRRIIVALLELYRDKDPGGFVGELEKWADPEVLSDLGTRKLEDFRAGLLRESRWALLSRVWKVMAFQGPDTMKASWAYVMLRLDQTGLLPRAYRMGDGPSLARQIRSWDPQGYASLLLSELQDLSWTLPTDGPGDQGEESPQGRAYGVLSSFGLAYHAYEKFWNSTDDGASLASLRALALELGEKGHHLESQRIMIRAARRFPRYGVENWKLRYPLAFADEIAQASREAEVEPDLFRSLVREESFYDPDISSPVGARGLSQLMPATAQAMLTKLRMDRNSSLTDPMINLTIGSRYFSERLKDFRSPAKALMAYNGGQGRVRTWNREFGHLPADLFVEACPLEETRNYVKKIFVTASYYKKIYDSKTSVLDLIYPGLKQ